MNTFWGVWDVLRYDKEVKGDRMKRLFLLSMVFLGAVIVEIVN